MVQTEFEPHLIKPPWTIIRVRQSTVRQTKHLIILLHTGAAGLVFAKKNSKGNE